jgi:DNA-binding CsgD family transcriptional regulator
MTLQERIQEALGEKAVPRNAIYGLLKGDQAASIDGELSMLLKRGAVSFELGCYQRINGHEHPLRQPVPQAPAPLTPHRQLVVSNGLTPRESQVFELIKSGLTHAEVAQRLGSSVNSVSQHLSAARAKLGIVARAGRPVGSGRERVEHTGPSAPIVVPVQAPAPPVEVPKIDIEPRRITFSPDLIVRLVELQRSKAMTLQTLLAMVTMVQQELADVEEIVRMATDGSRG